MRRRLGCTCLSELSVLHTFGMRLFRDALVPSFSHSHSHVMWCRHYLIRMSLLKHSLEEHASSRASLYHTGMTAISFCNYSSSAMKLPGISIVAVKKRKRNRKKRKGRLPKRLTEKGFQILRQRIRAVGMQDANAL